MEYDCPAADQAKEGDAEFKAGFPPMPHGTETILVVEDNELLRQMVAVILRECGYTVLEAGDPREAERETEQYRDKIDLLLTDLVMPGITGPELARRIKASRPSLKVIYMSGYGEASMADRGLFNPEVTCLQKPFSPETLAAGVREVLGHHEPKGRRQD